VGAEEIRAAIEAAVGYLTEHPGEARYTDSQAVAEVEVGLRCVVTGPDGASVGGGASAPSPGWLFRAALASCTATFIAMRAAQEGVEARGLSVTVDSESDDRGILGIDKAVPAGPLSVRVHVRFPSAGERAGASSLAEWGAAHCPVYDATGRAVPITLEVETN